MEEGPNFYLSWLIIVASVSGLLSIVTGHDRRRHYERHDVARRPYYFGIFLATSVAGLVAGIALILGNEPLGLAFIGLVALTYIVGAIIMPPKSPKG